MPLAIGVSFFATVGCALSGRDEDHDTRFIVAEDLAGGAAGSPDALTNLAVASPALAGRTKATQRAVQTNAIVSAVAVR